LLSRAVCFGAVWAGGSPRPIHCGGHRVSSRGLIAVGAIVPQIVAAPLFLPPLEGSRFFTTRSPGSCPRFFILKLFLRRFSRATGHDPNHTFHRPSTSIAQPHCSTLLSASDITMATNSLQACSNSRLVRFGPLTRHGPLVQLSPFNVAVVETFCVPRSHTRWVHSLVVLCSPVSRPDATPIACWHPVF